MIIGSGYDRDVGGAQGTGYRGLPYSSSYGVDVSTWLSFSKREQELWIQDVNRTQKQATYSEDSPQAYAYDYVNYVDDKREDVEDFKNTALGAVGYGFDSLILVGLAIVLLGKK